MEINRHKQSITEAITYFFNCIYCVQVQLKVISYKVNANY